MALGSNLGDRARHLEQAIHGLRATCGVGQVEISPVYETDPVGPPQGSYLNAVVSLTTTLQPRALLACLQAIEAAAGRERASERNAPRSLDLDLLFYGDHCLDEEGLQVPHPRLQERAFVLTPLADLAPALMHPRLRLSVSALLDRVRDLDGVRLYAGEGG